MCCSNHIKEQTTETVLPHKAHGHVKPVAVIISKNKLLKRNDEHLIQCFRKLQ